MGITAEFDVGSLMELVELGRSSAPRLLALCLSSAP